MEKQIRFDDGILVREVAVIAGVNIRTILRWIESGLVVGRKVGEGRPIPYLVSRGSLEAYLASKKKAGQSGN